MIVLRLLGYLWALPNTLIAVALLLFYRPQSWLWKDGWLHVVAGRRADGTTRIFWRPYGQTWGWITFWDTAEHRDDAAWRNHEGNHVLWSLILGVFFLLIWGFHWLWLFAVTNPSTPTGWPRARRAYWHVVLEVEARRVAGR